MEDVLEYLGYRTGIPYVDVSAPKEPTQVSLEGVDDWLVSVGQIFDRGMDIYESFEGRRRANKIIKSEQTIKTEGEPIPPGVYAKATAVAVAQEFKKPLVIGAVLFVGLGILLIYRK